MSETASLPTSNRSLPSPTAPSADRPRVSTRTAVSTDTSRSAMRRFGSLASGFTKKLIGSAVQAYRERKLEGLNARQSEMAAKNAGLMTESFFLQTDQNDILEKIITELRGLGLGSDEDSGEGRRRGRGRVRPRGQRGRFGRQARQRLRRIRAAQQARRVSRQSVTRPRPLAQPRPTRVEPTVRTTTPEAPRPRPSPTRVEPTARTPSPETPRPSPPPQSPRPTAQQLRANIRSRIPAAAMRVAASSARRIIPGAAIAIAAIPILNRLAGGDFAGAGIEFGAALAGSIPVVGIAAGAAAATVNESRDVYRDLLGVYPEDDNENPERAEIFSEIVMQVATYLSEAAEEQAREARERVATREAGPAAGAAAEFYADQPAPSQLGVQEAEETESERSVREAQQAQERRVEQNRNETAEIQRLWPEITEATRDVTDRELLRNLPRELRGTVRRAERELWLRRQRYQLYLNRSRTQPALSGLATPASMRAAGESSTDVLSLLQSMSDTEFNSITVEAGKISFDGIIRGLMQPAGNQYSTQISASPMTMTPGGIESTPAPTPSPVSPTTGSASTAPAATSTPVRSTTASRPRPGGNAVMSRIGRSIFGSNAPTEQQGAVSPEPPAQQAMTAPVVPSMGAGATGGGGGDGSISEVVERGPGFNVVRYDDGRVERRTGARNWRNNNPGNIEFGDFARRQGAIGTDGRFAIFPTYEVGKRAKEALLFEGRGYSGLTIAQAVTRYAPPSENDTAMYIRVVSSAAGVPPSTLMRDLNSDQRQALLNAMERVEGFRVGSVQVIQQGTALASAEQPAGPGPTLAVEGAQMAAADQAQIRGQGQEIVVQVPPASAQQRIADIDRHMPSGRGEVPLNRRLEKQVA